MWKRFGVVGDVLEDPLIRTRDGETADVERGSCWEVMILIVVITILHPQYAVSPLRPNDYAQLRIELQSND